MKEPTGSTTNATWGVAADCASRLSVSAGRRSQIKGNQSGFSVTLMSSGKMAVMMVTFIDPEKDIELMFCKYRKWMRGGKI